MIVMKASELTTARSPRRTERGTARACCAEQFNLRMQRATGQGRASLIAVPASVRSNIARRQDGA
ncbi:MAG: 50S ribosomal protein L29 [Chromatiales bacterium]|nr:50S ribosomal protein L29 [Chromatiales bacterium]